MPQMHIELILHSEKASKKGLLQWCLEPFLVAQKTFSELFLKEPLFS